MILAKLRNYLSSKSIAGSSINLLLSQIIISVSFLVIDYFIAHRHFEIFASWKQLQLLINLVLPVLAIGIPEAYKYYSAKEPNQFHFHYQFTLNALLLISLFWLVFAYFFLAPITLSFFHHTDFKYSAIGIIFLFFAINMNRVLRYECINEKKTRRFLIASICATALLILTFIFDDLILYNFPIAVRMSVFAIAIASFYFMPLLLLNSFKIESLAIITSKETWIKYLKIGFPLYIASFISIIVTNIDKAWLSHFYSKDSFAIYAAGALEIPLFAMLSAAFSQSTFPEYVRLLSADLQQEAKQLWINITRKVSYITYPTLFICMLFAKTIFSTIYGPSLLQGLIIFKTFLLIALWRNNYYGAILSASGKSKWISFYSVLNLGLVAAGIFIVTKFYSINALPWVLFISTSTLALLQIAHERMIGLYFKSFLLKPFTIIAITAILAAYFLSPF